MKRCKTCKHREHEKGQCKNCNCGQSEIVYSTSSRKESLEQIEEWVKMYE